jgi:hypothetical protein
VAKVHIVKPGDCLASIAHGYGFRSWKAIYNAAENAQLRQKRPNPNVLYAGDEVTIPDLGTKTTTGHSTDKKHKFVVHDQRWVLRIRMKDEQGNGIGDEPYELNVDGLFPFQGKSGSDGMIEAELPGHTRAAKLKFLGEEFDVQIGMLDPVSRVQGIQARLNNLGFNAGPVDGIVGKQTRRAVYDFQRSQPSLKATGTIDDYTRKLLLTVHDNDTRCTAAEEDMGPQDATSTTAETQEQGDDPPDEANDDAPQVDWRGPEGCIP